ncbi:hypothetical protein BGO17_04690 [Candidatus Saccharibacteria bacterium 49-20]|nr:MAG: hypothetical protein BGO17_04690 [Candidatus Saccharibacteria bacterium 49-20]
MTERYDPSIALENEDGDVISGADFDSLEHIVTDEQAVDAVAEYAAEAAASLVELPVEVAPPVTVSEAERRYDEASDKVERRRDQGVDDTIAWNEVDPSGAIRRAYNDEAEQKQAALNHARVAEIKEANRAAKIAAIEAIANPHARQIAMNEFLAHERAAEEIKNRGY